jgi:predicted Zn-dependent protease
VTNIVDENVEVGSDIRRLIEAREFDKAEQRLSEVQQAMSEESPVLNAAMAEIRNAQEDFDAAQAFAEKSLALDPDLIEGKFQLGCALFGKQQVDAAQALLDEIGGLLEGDARFLAQKAELCLRKYAISKACQYMDGATRLEPENSRYHALKAKYLLIQNKFSEAASIARRAAKLDINNLDAWSMLIRAILITSKKGESDKEIRKIRKAIPQPQLVDTEIADYFVSKGRCAEAEQKLQEVISNHPGFAQGYQVLTNLYVTTKQWSKAIDAGYKALGFSPYSLNTWRKIGIALAENREHYVAMTWLHKVLLADPEDIFVGTLYARSLHQIREYNAAHDLYIQILQEHPDKPHILQLYAQLLMDMERHKEAVEVIKRAHELAKNDDRIQMDLAMAFSNAGDFEAARKIYRRVMAHRPEFSEVFLYYTDITPMAEDEELAQLITGYEATAEFPNQKEDYNFALAKIYEDKRDFEKAFQYLSSACSLHKQRIGYNETGNLNGMKLLKSIFTADFLKRFESCGSDSTRPYFVLGMPRSGTTLVEQILSSHPEVEGGGELTVTDSILRNHGAKLGKPMVHSLADLDCEGLSHMANEYLTMTASLGAEALHLVNKLPHNFLYLGLISLMFPNAKIIHLKRDPMAICFSCYKKRFISGHDYSFDLQDLGNYYLGYQDLMNHWYSVLPGRIYTVEYEKLISDFETETRRLIDHCGLEWDDACLRYHKSKRAVRTASQSQVRKPIYTKAVSFWRNYEKQLKPLADILQAAEAGDK